MTSKHEKRPITGCTTTSHFHLHHHCHNRRLDESGRTAWEEVTRDSLPKISERSIDSSSSERYSRSFSFFAFASLFYSIAHSSSHIYDWLVKPIVVILLRQLGQMCFFIFRILITKKAIKKYNKRTMRMMCLNVTNQFEKPDWLESQIPWDNKIHIITNLEKKNPKIIEVRKSTLKIML